MVTIPKLWPGETCVCLGGGPSLTRDDVEFARGKARVIAINDAYTLAPWADVLYACDGQWWRRNPAALEFVGLKYSLTAKPAHSKYVQILRYSGELGFDPDPRYLRTGWNGGYQAIHLAVHLGAKRIVLLGYDMQRSPRGKMNWYPNQGPKPQSPYSKFLQAFPTLVKPLRGLGVQVINCSRSTKLTCFPQMKLEDVFVRAEAAA